MSDPRYVWLLWHGDDIDDHTPEAKLLGVYSSEEQAQARITRSHDVAGFSDWPDAYVIARYAVDSDKWLEGFVRLGSGE